MKRRNFLKFLATVPIIGHFIPTANADNPKRLITIKHVLIDDKLYFVNQVEVFGDAPWVNHNNWYTRTVRAWLPKEFALQGESSYKDTAIFYHGEVEVTQHEFETKVSGALIGGVHLSQTPESMTVKIVTGQRHFGAQENRIK